MSAVEKSSISKEIGCSNRTLQDEGGTGKLLFPVLTPDILKVSGIIYGGCVSDALDLLNAFLHRDGDKRKTLNEEDFFQMLTLFLLAKGHYKWVIMRYLNIITKKIATELRNFAKKGDSVSKSPVNILSDV
jgi:hypothetical protein